jgi:hypothetical protein
MTHEQHGSSFRTRTAIGFAAGLLIAATLALPVMAADTVIQVINGGARTASVADLTLTPLTYSNSAQSNAGTMTLTVDDASGTGAGWNVTIQSSAFLYSGANSGSNIPAANFSLAAAATPVMTAGQAVDATNGPKVPASSPVGTLDSARKVVQANANYGLGTYTQALSVSLSVPAQSRAGTYTGTLTTTISAAP